MPDGQYKYIWRCAKCGNHFANIVKSDGFIKQEKKCPKCKSLNVVTLADKEIHIQCHFHDPRQNGYNDEDESFSYPVIGR